MLKENQRETHSFATIHLHKACKVAEATGGEGEDNRYTTYS